MRFARPGEKLLALNGQRIRARPGDDRDRRRQRRAEPRRRDRRRGDRRAPRRPPKSIVEAALFDPVRTAATGRRLEIVSDARYRFERGIDPAFVGAGLEIATRLILELCGGEPSEIVARRRRAANGGARYTLRPERTAGLGGLHVPPAESRAILEALGCTVGEPPRTTAA